MFEVQEVYITIYIYTKKNLIIEVRSLFQYYISILQSYKTSQLSIYDRWYWTVHGIWMNLFGLLSIHILRTAKICVAKFVTGK